MIDLPYSLVIEATDEPDYFGFYSTELEGFAGIGHSVEDCIYKAKWGMKEHVALLEEHGLPIPPTNIDPRIIVRNEKKPTPEKLSRLEHSRLARECAKLDSAFEKALAEEGLSRSLSSSGCFWYK